MTGTAWGIIITGSKADEFAADVDTAFLTLGSKPVLTYSLNAFERCPDVEGLVLVATKERIESIRAMVQMFGCYKVKKIIPAPASRTASILAGLKVLEDHRTSIVVVHEGTRPCVTPEQISETIKSARKFGSGVLATHVTEPIKDVPKGTKVKACLPAGTLWATASPQSFKFDILRKAVETAARKKTAFQDEAEALAMVKADVHIVPTQRPALKIGSPRDLMLADLLLRH